MAGLLSYKHWAYWLAAIIDGEGYISVDRRLWTNGQAYYSVSVGVKNTHLGLLEQVQRVAGCGSIRPAQSRAGSKTVYVWLAHGPNTTPILKAIHRLLVVKGEQARLALKLQSTKLGLGHHRPPEVAAYQAEIYEAVKILNRRGQAALTNQDSPVNDDASPPRTSTIALPAGE